MLGMFSLRGLSAALALVLALAVAAACTGGDDGGDDGDGRLRVVASTGIIAHFAEQIAGEDADIVAVIPAGADAHSFSATTTDIRNISAADIVIVNGYNLEEGALGTIFEHLPGDATLVVAAEGVDPLEGGHHEEERGGRSGRRHRGRRRRRPAHVAERPERDGLRAQHRERARRRRPGQRVRLPRARGGLPRRAAGARRRGARHDRRDPARAPRADRLPRRLPVLRRRVRPRSGCRRAAGQPLAAGERRRRRRDHRDRLRAQCGRRVSRAAVRRRRARDDRRGGGRARADALQRRLHG